MVDHFYSLDNISAQLGDQAQAKKLPPVEKWNPPLSGDLDLVIKRDGTWLHEGSPIQRQELVRLFSTVLKREGDDYFLVTPVEKWRIQVEDVPLHAVSVQVTQVNNLPALAFVTRTDDLVVADAEHPIRVAIDPDTAEPSPYITVRANLDALIVRSVFYQLVEMAVQEMDELVVYSVGHRFVLGRL